MIELAATLFILYIVYKVLCLVLGLSIIGVIIYKDREKVEIVETIKENKYPLDIQDYLVLLAGLLIAALLCYSKVVYQW